MIVEKKNAQNLHLSRDLYAGIYCMDFCGSNESYYVSLFYFDFHPVFHIFQSRMGPEVEEFTNIPNYICNKSPVKGRLFTTTLL